MFQEVLDVIAAVKSERVNYTVKFYAPMLSPDGEVGSVWREQYFGRRAIWIVKKCQTDLVGDGKGLLCLLR
jgi:hypothetical protein